MSSLVSPAEAWARYGVKLTGPVNRDLFKQMMSDPDKYLPYKDGGSDTVDRMIAKFNHMHVARGRRAQDRLTDAEKAQRLAFMYGSVKARSSGDIAAAFSHTNDQFIKESIKTMGDNTTPDQRIKQAEEALAKAIAAKQEADEREAFGKRIDNDVKLAEATALLLVRIRSLALAASNATSVGLPEFARFRKELQPLAESYGMKIVLVGDRTTASVVAA